MGYRRPPLTLTFTDPEYEGLEVKCRRPSIGDALRIARLRAGITDGNVDERLAEMLAMVAGMIASWNLEDDDGRPVPTTAEGVGAQDYNLIMAILGAIVPAVAGVSPPLPQPSNGGEPSLEASIPMETLSPNPPN